MTFTIHPVTRLVQVNSLVTLLNNPKKPGFYFDGESHDFWEAVFVYSGEVTATADEKIYHMRPGTFLLHKPMEFHRIWEATGVAPKLLTISFRAQGPALENMENFCYQLSPELQTLLWSIVDTFQKMLDQNTEGRTNLYQHSANLVATMLEIFLLRLTKNEAYLNHVISPNESCFSQILQTMKEHCHQSISVPELANLCNMSVSNMKRIFSLYSDMSIGKYFLQLKMQRAMDMLDCGTPAREVAKALDYSEVSYFYAVFKRETGMTPAQYIKRKNEEIPVLKV